MSDARDRMLFSEVLRVYQQGQKLNEPPAPPDPSKAIWWEIKAPTALFTGPAFRTWKTL